MHAGSMLEKTDCQNCSEIGVGGPGDDCYINEYGNRYDILGGWYERAHPSMVIKERLGG